jgi:hypothetical protein
MKKAVLLVLLSQSFFFSFAQSLPVKTVTVFKNTSSLIYKSGKVPLKEGKYTVTEFPNALFGTYWVSGAPNELQSVFTAIDSVETPQTILTKTDLLRNNLNKPLRLLLESGSVNGYESIEAVCLKAYNSNGYSDAFIFKTKSGNYLSLSSNEIHRIEFLETPSFDLKNKTTQNRLQLNFKPGKNEAEIGLSYLTNQIGWTPVYRLELDGKTKGNLSLRAEILNDAEDLGSAELRLAVGIPNYKFAVNPSILFNYGRGGSLTSGYNGPAQMANYQVAFDAETYEERVVAVPVDQPEGYQAEDFYFYTVRPGNFPKNSRYQYPIFQTDILPTHYFETVLPATSPGSYRNYSSNSNQPNSEKFPVFHYIEFKNTTNYPWTTGATNILSQSSAGLQPLSQDMLPYTAPGGTCKVKIAQTPEIKITHGEGDVDRQENAKRFFSTTYDKVKIEAQLCVVNYKTEPVTLKIRRPIEGTPLISDQPWNNKQEQATLRVNPSYMLEWDLELKPGEERKWNYTYEVFVNM